MSFNGHPLMSDARVLHDVYTDSTNLYHTLHFHKHANSMVGAFDLFVGIVGLLTVIPLVYRFLNSRLPTMRLRTLFQALEETESFFVSCVEDGLIAEKCGDEYRLRLSQLRSQADDARRQALCANGFFDDFLNMLSGLTGMIDCIRDRVITLRSRISTTSVREHLARLKEAEQNAALGGSPPLEASVPTMVTDETAFPSPGIYFDASHLSRILAGPDPTPQNLTKVSTSSPISHPSTAPLPSPKTVSKELSPVTDCPHRQDSTSSYASTANTRNRVHSKVKDPVSRQFATARFLRRTRRRRSESSSTPWLTEIVSDDPTVDSDEGWEDEPVLSV